MLSTNLVENAFALIPNSLMLIEHTNLLSRIIVFLVNSTFLIITHEIR